MIAVMLCSLAVADGAFSGFRAYAGRDGRIVQRNAKAQASLTGAAAGVAVLVVLAGVLLGAVGLGLTTYDVLVEAGTRMSVVYAIYAAIISIGFAAYFSPWLEVRSLGTMLVLGPGTFVRPAVIVGGALLAGVPSGWIVTALALVTSGLVLLVEPALWVWFDHRQVTTLTPFATPRRSRFRRT